MEFTVKVIAFFGIEDSSRFTHSAGNNFTDAIESYQSAIEYFKGEITWGSKYRKARVEFHYGDSLTEITMIFNPCNGAQVTVSQH